MQEEKDIQPGLRGDCISFWSPSARCNGYMSHSKKGSLKELPIQNLLGLVDDTK